MWSTHKNLLFISFFVLISVPFGGVDFSRVYAQSSFIVQPCEPTGAQSYDVACRCKKNQCRLSSMSAEVPGEFVTDGNYDIASADPNLIAQGPISTSTTATTRRPGYVCIDGVEKLDANTFRLGQQGENQVLAKFTVSNVYQELKAGGSALRDGADPKNSVYVDIFANDVNRTSIPKSSFCKLDPQTGVAYWYYPGYFSVIGLNPSGNSEIFGPGGLCENVLFSSRDLFGQKITGTQTFFGCLPNSPNGLVAFIVRLITGLAVIITFLIILINLLQIISNSTNPDIIIKSQKKMTSAIITLVVILFTITILNIIGIQIIGLDAGGIFGLFTGG
jgi:succinate dehydrogenase hydrophobic anchor subunit